MMELVPPSVAAAVAVLVGVLITGAFHEDGLADLADAMGGWTPEQRREILKDSRHGSYGVAALCGSIVLRIVCVATLGPAVAFAGLVAAHTFGRSAAVGVMIARRDVEVGAGVGAGLASGSIRQLRPRAAVVGVVTGLAIGIARDRLVGGAARGSVPRSAPVRRRGSRVRALGGDQRRHARRRRTGRRMPRPRHRHRPRHPPPALVDLTSFHVCDKKLETRCSDSCRKRGFGGWEGQLTRVARRVMPSTRSSSPRANENRP